MQRSESDKRGKYLTETIINTEAQPAEIINNIRAEYLNKNGILSVVLRGSKRG